MIIVIRNMTGLDLYAAAVADERSFRCRITLDPPGPAEKRIVIRLRPGDAHGIPGCPEDLKVRVEATESIRVVRRRELVDALDDRHEPVGPEIYLEFTLRLLN